MLRDRGPSLKRRKAAAVADDYLDPADLDDEIDEDDEEDDDLPRLPAAKRADEGRVTRRIEQPKTGARAAREAQTSFNLGDREFELTELSLLKPAPRSEESRVGKECVRTSKY